MADLKQGKDTSEWQGYMRAIAAIIVAVAGGLATMPFVQQSEVAVGIVSLIGVVAAAIAGMQWKYTAGRSQVKAAAELAKAKGSPPEA